MEQDKAKEPAKPKPSINFLLPEKDWNEKRMKAIDAAMKKCNRSGQVIPRQWVAEYNALMLRNLKLK